MLSTNVPWITSLPSGITAGRSSIVRTRRARGIILPARFSRSWTRARIPGLMSPRRSTGPMSSPEEQISQAYAAYQKLMVMQALAGENNSRFVPGEGPLNSPLLFVGEAPGEDEDREGRPFVGRSGQCLDKLVSQAGLSRSACRITNVVHYRPPRNRTPYVFELTASWPCLLAEIMAVRPMVIATLGSIALRMLDDKLPLMSKRHGQHEPWTSPDGSFSCDLVPLYHPSWILPEDKEDLMLAALR